MLNVLNVSNVVLFNFKPTDIVLENKCLPTESLFHKILSLMRMNAFLLKTSYDQ